MGIEEDLQRAQRRAAEMRELSREMEDAAPARAEGADRARSVRVVLGRDGVPESIRVDDRWRDRIGPDSLGAAIAEASQAALRCRGEAWSRALEQSGWPDRAGRQAPGPGRVPDPAPGSRPAPGPRPRRSVSDLAEEVIAMSAKVTAASRPAARAQGSTPGRHVVITLARGGSVSAAVDAAWAGKQVSGLLNQALGTALAAALEELNRPEEEPGDAARLSRLFEESLSMINQPAQPLPAKGRQA